jgi:hypothetical protein
MAGRKLVLWLAPVIRDQDEEKRDVPLALVVVSEDCGVGDEKQLKCW